MLTLTRRTLDALMDIQTPAGPQSLEFLNDLAQLNAREANDGQPQTPANVAFEDWRDRRRQRWQDTLPIRPESLGLNVSRSGRSK